MLDHTTTSSICQFARQSFAMHTTLLSVRAGRVTNGRVSPADTIIQNWDRAMGHKKLYITHLFMTAAAACTHAQWCINCCVRPLDKSVNSNVENKLLQMHETKQTNKKCPGLTPSLHLTLVSYMCVCVHVNSWHERKVPPDTGWNL